GQLHAAEFVHDIINVTGASFAWTAAAFRFLNPQVYSGIVSHTNNTSQGADSFGGGTAAANQQAHIFWSNFDGKKYAEFINSSGNDDLVGTVNNLFYDYLNKLSISIFSHCFILKLISCDQSIKTLELPIQYTKPRCWSICPECR